MQRKMEGVSDVNQTYASNAIQMILPNAMIVSSAHIMLMGNAKNVPSIVSSVINFNVFDVQEVIK